MGLEPSTPVYKTSGQNPLTCEDCMRQGLFAGFVQHTCISDGHPSRILTVWRPHGASRALGRIAQFAAPGKGGVSAR